MCDMMIEIHCYNKPEGFDTRVNGCKRTDVCLRSPDSGMVVGMWMEWKCWKPDDNGMCDGFVKKG